MGAETPQKVPTEPEKTLKGMCIIYAEQVKEYTKEINKMRREYGREKYKLEYTGKTLSRDLKRKIDKKESKVKHIFIYSKPRRWSPNRSSRIIK